jgi:hypothetical protein
VTMRTGSSRMGRNGSASWRSHGSGSQRRSRMGGSMRGHGGRQRRRRGDVWSPAFRSGAGGDGLSCCGHAQEAFSSRRIATPSRVDRGRSTRTKGCSPRPFSHCARPPTGETIARRRAEPPPASSGRSRSRQARWFQGGETMSFGRAGPSLMGNGKTGSRRHGLPSGHPQSPVVCHPTLTLPGHILGVAVRNALIYRVSGLLAAPNP